jgi:ATP-dependent DNA ligase
LGRIDRTGRFGNVPKRSFLWAFALRTTLKENLPNRSTMPTRTRSPTISPPAWIKPELAALVKTAPEGTDWLHEMKLDGYRMHAQLDAGRASNSPINLKPFSFEYPTGQAQTM